MARKLLGTLCLWVGSSLIAKLILGGAKNLLDGKDILGNAKIQKEKTYEDWHGNVVLGKEDYKVV